MWKQSLMIVGMIILSGCHVPPAHILQGSWLSICQSGEVNGENYYLRETLTFDEKEFRSVTRRYEEVDPLLDQGSQSEFCQIDGVAIEVRGGSVTVTENGLTFGDKELIRIDAVDTPQLLPSNSYPYSVGSSINWRKYYYLDGDTLYPADGGGFSGVDDPVTEINFAYYWKRQ